MSIQFTIPGKPVSQNACYRRRGGRGQGMFLSEEGRFFKQRVMALARATQGTTPTITAEVGIRLAFFFPTRLNDIDGPVKPTLDALQEAGLIENDRQVRTLLVEKEHDKTSPRTEVELWLFGEGSPA